MARLKQPERPELLFGLNGQHMITVLGYRTKIRLVMLPLIRWSVAMIVIILSQFKICISEAPKMVFLLQVGRLGTNLACESWTANVG